MNFSNGDVVVYHNNGARIINIVDIVDSFNIKKISSESNVDTYDVLDEIYIDTVNSQFKLEYDKIEQIYVTPNTNLEYISINDDYTFMSNIICFNNKQKKTYISPVSTLENKFVIQHNAQLAYTHATFIDDIHLNRNAGYITGYWLLRGGFFKMDGDEYPSWSGRDMDIDKLKPVVKNYTSVVKPFKDTLKILLLIEEQWKIFLKNNFINNNTKTIPKWLIIAKQEFLQGLMYGLIASNSYISTDIKNNYYLAIKIQFPHFISIIKDIFKFRFNIHSRLVGNDTHLSFKFNKKLYEFIKVGIDMRYIDIETFDDITPILNKEIIHNEFKIVPWYKFKSNVNNIKTPISGGSMKLKNANNFMFFNGVFTNC